MFDNINIVKILRSSILFVHNTTFYVLCTHFTKLKLKIKMILQFKNFIFVYLLIRLMKTLLQLGLRPRYSPTSSNNGLALPLPYLTRLSLWPRSPLTIPHLTRPAASPPAVPACLRPRFPLPSQLLHFWS